MKVEDGKVIFDMNDPKDKKAWKKVIIAQMCIIGLVATITLGIIVYLIYIFITGGVLT